VRQIFAWVGLERVSLHEVCRRLADAGCRTRTGLVRWDPTTVCGMLRNPAYIGQAAFGRSRFVPAQPRLRPIRGRPWPSRKANTRVPTTRDEWIAVPVPALIEPALFTAAQAQLEENRRHRREGRRRPGWLLQGLVICRRCGYAFYGKMARGKVGGGKTAEYGYYRCLGTDGHRFGGTAPCDNRSVRSDCLELAIWNEIRLLLEDPHRLAAEYRRRLDALRHDAGDRIQAAVLDRQIEGLRRGIGRLIDSYAEGVIEQHEFQSRIVGLKERLARVREQRQALVEAAEAERSLTLVIGRVGDFAAKVRHSLDELDWSRTREIIRALVRRIEVDGEAIEVVFRVPPPSPDNGPGGAGRSSIPPDRQHRGSGHDPTLWRSPVPGDKLAPIAHRGSLQPALDVEERPGATGVLAHGPEQQLVIDVVEEALDVDVEHPVGTPASLAGRPDGVDRRPAGTITVGVGVERRFQQRLQVSTDHLLRDTIGDRRDTQRPHPAACFRYVHPAYRRGHVAA
jgi:site-specific DNA recombinase